MSESLPFFTDADFSVLHFFSFLSSIPFLLLFATLFYVEEWLKCLVLQKQYLPLDKCKILSICCRAFVEKLKVIQLIKKCHVFMVIGGSLLYSQKPSVGPLFLSLDVFFSLPKIHFSPSQRTKSIILIFFRIILSSLFLNCCHALHCRVSHEATWNKQLASSVLLFEMCLGYAHSDRCDCDIAVRRKLCISEASIFFCCLAIFVRCCLLWLLLQIAFPLPHPLNRLACPRARLCASLYVIIMAWESKEVLNLFKF